MLAVQESRSATQRQVRMPAKAGGRFPEGPVFSPTGEAAESQFTVVLEHTKGGAGGGGVRAGAAPECPAH